MLATVTVTDIDRRVIPNEVLAVAALAGLAIVAASDPGSLPVRTIAAAGAGGFLLAAALVRPGGMGMGDVKLAAVMGLYLGAAVLPALLVAFAVGGVAGVWLIARHGAAARRLAIPFGPFLALGGAVAVLAGNGLVAWYVAAVGG